MNANDYYIISLAEKIRTEFENETGKTIGTGVYFDMTEVINFYGGIIEYDDLYEEKYKLNSYIYKIDNDEKTFKIVIDKEKAKELKPIDEFGKIQYGGKWNMFIMELFYETIININRNMKDGDIIYPNPNYVKKAIEQKKVKNNNKNKYTLFGTMNIIDIIPDFVYPIFESNGKYYFQNSNNNIEIDSFDEIINEKYISKIKPLNLSFNKLVNIKEYYEIGDEPLVAFQLNENTYFIGKSDDFNEFIKEVKIEDEKLSKDIHNFQNEIKSSKTLKKIK